MCSTSTPTATNSSFPAASSATMEAAETRATSVENSSTPNQDEKDENKTSNEYVLNVAFASFLGFTLLQTSFAFLAKSQSMLTDSQAMAVDAITYMFNLLAERLKNRKLTPEEQALPLEVRNRRRRLQRLVLELVPPLISVTILLFVTVLAMGQAFETIVKEHSEEDDPDLTIMLFFSGLNLILDILNVMVFSKADHGVAIHVASSTPASPKPKVQKENDMELGRIATEKTSLLSRTPSDHTDPLSERSYAKAEHNESEPAGEHCHHHHEEDGLLNINLNMCSAWTHIFADTLRSITVLSAAAISSLFPSVLSASDADSYGAIVVSIIILLSLGPLVQGLFMTAWELRNMLFLKEGEKPHVTVVLEME